MTQAAGVEPVLAGPSGVYADLEPGTPLGAEMSTQLHSDGGSKITPSRVKCVVQLHTTQRGTRMKLVQTTVEDRLAHLQAELEKLQKQAHDEAVRKARFPWENPEIMQNQERTGYNFKIDPELYLKIQWIMENKGGIKSIQVFLDRAAKKMAQEILAELGAA
jgi:hypothetical protein